MSDDDNNLASKKFDHQWEEGIFDMSAFGDGGHCHTYNPGSQSLAPHNGLLYALLGGRYS